MDLFDEDSFNLRESKVLHKDNLQTVYLVEYKNQELIVKEKKITREMTLNHYLSEVYILGAMNHKSISPILGAFISTDRLRIYIVRKYFINTLLDEINYRRIKNRPWLKGELTKIFNELISAFAYMQRQGIVHCNISPRNILKGKNKYLIAGFDYSYYKNPRPRENLEVNYLSPMIALKQNTYKNEPSTINHNAFKSDVYSLGLTFLHMGCLSNIEGLESHKQDRLNTEINNRILRIEGNENKNLLRSMLCYAENNRPDFINLGELPIRQNRCLTPIPVAKKNPKCGHVKKISNATDFESQEVNYICVVCKNQGVNFSNNFIFRDSNYYHAECFDSILESEIKLYSFSKLNDKKLNEKFTYLVLCDDCRKITYKKQEINKSLCLNCIGTNEDPNLSDSYRIYKCYNRFCEETFNKKPCENCLEHSELLLNSCHNICYSCLKELHPKVQRTISCYWGCCGPIRINF